MSRTPSSCVHSVAIGAQATQTAATRIEAAKHSVEVGLAGEDLQADTSNPEALTLELFVLNLAQMLISELPMIAEPARLHGIQHGIALAGDSGHAFLEQAAGV